MTFNSLSDRAETDSLCEVPLGRALALRLEPIFEARRHIPIVIRFQRQPEKVKHLVRPQTDRATRVAAAAEFPRARRLPAPHLLPRIRLLQAIVRPAG